MDENNRAHATSSSDQVREKRARVPYQRTVPHITQDPITDDTVTYQQRPQAAPRPAVPQRPAMQGARPGRKHMGVATSDPQYLQPTGRPQGVPNGPAHPRHKMPGDGEPQVLHSDRYLTMPSSRKSIFTARQNRARRRTRTLAALLVVVIIAVIAIILFVL